MIPHALHALLSNEIALNPAALWPDEAAFRVGADDGAVAWGVGTVQDGRALVKRRPRLGNHVFDFEALIEDAPSRFVVGVVLAGEGDRDDAVATDSVPPFRFHNWILGAYPWTGRRLSAEQRAKVRALLPESMLHALEGESDAELVVQAIASGIASSRAHKNADFPAELAAELVRDGTQAVRAILGADGALDAVIGNGRVLVAQADSRPLHYRVVDGLDDDPIEARRRRDMHLGPRPVARPHFRAIVVSSVALSTPGWVALSEGQVLCWDARHGTRILPGAGTRAAPRPAREPD